MLPKLDYCSSVWDPHTTALVNRLETLPQNSVLDPGPTPRITLCAPLIGPPSALVACAKYLYSHAALSTTNRLYPRLIIDLPITLIPEYTTLSLSQYPLQGPPHIKSHSLCLPAPSRTTITTPRFFKAALSQLPAFFVYSYLTINILYFFYCTNLLWLFPCILYNLLLAVLPYPTILCHNFFCLIFSFGQPSY